MHSGSVSPMRLRRSEMAEVLPYTSSFPELLGLHGHLSSGMLKRLVTELTEHNTVETSRLQQFSITSLRRRSMETMRGPL